MKARIMTFNTQHCAMYKNNLQIGTREFANAIRIIGADVVGLNEIRGEGPDSGYTDQTGELAEYSGLKNRYFARAILFSGTLPYGNALISRFGIESAQTVIIPDPRVKKYDGYYETRCILKARLDCGLTVLVTHVGLNPDEKRNAIKALVKLIEKERCIVMGDFNMTPDNPLIKKISKKICDTGAYIDGNGFTFISDNPYEKIDYVFHTPDVKLTCVSVPELILSDHRPIVAEFEW